MYSVNSLDFVCPFAVAVPWQSRINRPEASRIMLWEASRQEICGKKKETWTNHGKPTAKRTTKSREKPKDGEPRLCDFRLEFSFIVFLFIFSYCDFVI